MRGASREDAKFFWSGGPVEIAPRTWFVSRFSGITAFETDEGLVLVDSGLKIMAADLAATLRTVTKAPVHTAIFTQGHTDHAFGLEAFLMPGQPRPRIIAHRAMPARFERYARTAGYNAAINARQFGGTVRAANEDGYKTFGFPALPPDTLYDQRMDITVGGLSFQIHHCRGETDDHSWIYCPKRSVLCPGDLMIWAVPNAGNPQKVQRYPWDWAAGLRAMAAVAPASLCPGHGGPVVNDPALCRRILLETADFLEAIVTRTLAVMEQGAPPHVDIVQAVELPVSDSPWLQPVYDDAEFIIRTVIRYFGGWYSGRPGELKPAPRAALAGEIAALAGGAGALATRAEALVTAGDMRLACHLADFALEADPGNAAVQAAAARVYEARAESETALMVINIFNSAAAYAREGLPHTIVPEIGFRGTKARSPR
ncbi:MAG: MBL fold metallo-hydrolase [Alphaproteobacteria bacterium]|nr:MBL fold metallo-hydrolase [Alphaproteobacteria bacterium]